MPDRDPLAAVRHCAAEALRVIGRARILAASMAQGDREALEEVIDDFDAARLLDRELSCVAEAISVSGVRCQECLAEYSLDPAGFRAQFDAQRFVCPACTYEREVRDQLGGGRGL